MTGNLESKDNEKTPMAPTVSIEQVAVVRPIKVVSMLCIVLAVFLNCLSIGATTWLTSDYHRNGLWETCNYIEEGVILCRPVNSIDWMEACRILFIVGMVVASLAIGVVAVGLTTQLFHRKIKYYITGMILMVIAAISEIVCLIIFPVKSGEELEKNGHDIDFGHGWAYGLGWIAAILMMIGAVIIYIDKNADELVYREKTYYNDSIEEFDV